MTHRGDHLSRDDLAGLSWGAAYLRELDLMIAANVLASLQSGECLYDEPFNRACATRMMPLDGGLEMRRLPTVTIPDPTGGRPEHRAVDDAVAGALRDTPRGHWAVFRLGERYDAYISNGLGRFETQSGHKFTLTSETAPAFTDAAMYAEVISMMIHRQRGALDNAIVAHNIAASGLAKGATATDVELGGKTWSRVVYEEVKVGHYSGGGNAYRVTAHRRGVRPTGFIVQQGTLQDLYGLPFTMPPEYEDADNADRVLDIVKPRPADAIHPYGFGSGARVEIRIG